MQQTPVRVVVAIATYRRPATVRATVEQVLAQLGDHGSARVLVVDNDPDGSARRSILEMGEARLDYVVEPQPGIAAARNRALDEARADDVLVFIDDDETPQAGWFAALSGLWQERRPQAVAGPVASRFDVEPDPWIVAGGFFERRRPATGTAVALAATNNLLLDLDFVRQQGLRFDERFGLSGGSDTLFTHHLTAAGGTILWCAEAMVTDHVPAERLTRAWVLSRAMRYGNSAARVAIATTGGPRGRLVRRVRLAAQGLARVVAGTLRSGLGVATGSVRHQARGARTRMKGVGYVRGVVGSVYVEYRRG